MVTKGFCPLAQDAVYRLSDMEEDEEDEEHGGIGVLEKGASERGKEDEDEEEEEGGITFKVRVSSTPEERKDRKHSVSPLPVPILSPTLPMLPGTPATTSSVTSVLCLTPTPHHATDKSSLSSQPIPGVCTTVVQSQTSICTSISTTASSSGKILCFNEQFEFLPSQLKILITWFVCVSVQYPGKCHSSTFSTYTFTTCRILHPTDITQVTQRQVLRKLRKRNYVRLCVCGLTFLTLCLS